MERSAEGEEMKPKLSPERQAEYDAMGLPLELCCIEEFALKASNAYHANQQEIEDLKKQVERIARNIHYPECWDTGAYPTLADAVCEITYCDPKQCSHPKESEEV